MDRKKRELRTSLRFFQPWLQCHLNNCTQYNTYVSWHRDEQFSYAVSALDESLTRNIENGHLFTLTFEDLRSRNGEKLKIRGAISVPSSDSENQVLGSMDNFMIKFIDITDIYTIYHSEKVAILNRSLFHCYKEQLENLATTINKVEQDPLLSKLLTNDKYRTSKFSFNLGYQNKLDCPFKTPYIYSSCNNRQKNVIKQAVNNRVTLVDGPPGASKTFTTALLVFNLYKTRLKEDSKILIYASSNVAVDNLAIKILELSEQLNLVRIRSIESEKSVTTQLLDPFYLDRRITTEKGDLFDEYRLLVKKEQEKFGNLIHVEKSLELRSLEKKCERIIINKADVLCATCFDASKLSRLFDGNTVIDSLVIDECNQVTLPEALVAIRFCPRRIVAVGDDKQLGVAINDRIRESLPQYTHNRLSLFRILKRKGFKPLFLNVQYRMHPVLTEFSNQTLYENKIKNGLKHEDRQWSDTNHRSPFPKQDMPIYFHCHNFPETEGGRKSKSRFNEGEVDIVVETIKVLLSRGVDGHVIGVITPYKSQCQKIKGKLLKIVEDLINTNNDNRRKRRSNRRAKKRNEKFITNFNRIEIATVDAYQGREKDYIILSMVRSLEEGRISFVADERRFNVSLTRARFGLIVVGNPAVLKREPLLHQYIVYLSQKGLLFDTILSEDSKSITLATFERLNSLIKIPATLSITIGGKDRWRRYLFCFIHALEWSRLKYRQELERVARLNDSQ